MEAQFRSQLVQEHHVPNSVIETLQIVEPLYSPHDLSQTLKMQRFPLESDVGNRKQVGGSDACFRYFIHENSRLHREKVPRGPNKHDDEY